MSESLSKLKQIQAVLDEKRLGHDERKLTRLQKFLHFWVLVGRSFVANRCLVRASALAYTTLLALIPLLAVAFSVATSFLKGKSGQQTLEGLVTSAIQNVAPQLGLARSGAVDPVKQITDLIFSAISNVSAGTLGTTAIIGLVFVGISLLANIETTLNDIWGVHRGRSWFARVVQYWAAITLGPLLLIVALGLNVSSRIDPIRNYVIAHFGFAGPTVVGLISQVLPVVLLVAAFGLFYQLMPNTRVHWRAALVGGIVGGVLVHLNNAFSTIYLGQVVQNSKIYGSLAILPIFLIGLYFSWVILLFGAQVSYAFQNRRAYFQEKLAENINQRGREFVALRLMTCVAQRFAQGLRPPTALELADAIGVPTRLVQRILEPLLQSSLVVEVAGTESGYAPARPLNKISYYDILEALRSSQGQPVTTREDALRGKVQAEAEKIQQAERAAAETITLEKFVS
jgi:membrane protein